MSTSPTSKLGIALPVPGSGEPYTVSGFNAMITSLDTAAGFTICTNATRPASPFTGQSIFETDTLVPYVWDGSAWQVAGGGGSIEISATAPASPSAGDLWWDSDDGKLFIYYDDGDSSQWVDAAGPSVAVQDTAPTGYEGQLWLDSTDGSMYVYYTDPGGGASSWIGAVSRSGGILQVVSTTKTDTFTTSSETYTDITGLTASITPSSTSSKILVMYSVFLGQNTGTFPNVRLLRDSTAIAIGDASGSLDRVTLSSWTGGEENYLTVSAGNFLDSPNTTSSTTYKFQIRAAGSAEAQYVNRDRRDSTINDPRAISTITLIEVAG